MHKPNNSTFLGLLLMFICCLVAAEPPTPSSSSEIARISNDSSTPDDIQIPDNELNTTGQSHLWEMELSEYLEDWSSVNYSSRVKYTVLRTQEVDGKEGKIYDVGSWKGGDNDDWFAIAFHLSTEVAVSAAQARNGTLLGLAKVEGDIAYKNLMSQVQKDLKGNRSEYYAEPKYEHGYYSVATYLERIYYYLRHGPPPPQNITDPYPIFTNIILTLHSETESTLGAKLNTSGFGDKIRIHVSSPFKLNYTYTLSAKKALNDLGFGLGPWSYDLTVRPDVEWSDHMNDQQDWGGENGTVMAFEYAKKGAEMLEYNPQGWYGDFLCGTFLGEDMMRVEEEQRANGTWVEPPPIPVKNILRYYCKDWSRCWRALKWGNYFGDFTLNAYGDDDL